MSQASVAHCEVAWRLAGRLGLAETLINALGFTLERWDGSGPGASKATPFRCQCELVISHGTSRPGTVSLEQRAALHRSSTTRVQVSIPRWWSGSANRRQRS
jgi:hypothetical protein